MGSIDIPPFLREKMKQKVQAKQKPEIPPFMQSEVEVEPSKKKVGTIGFEESSLQAGNSLSTGVGSEEIPTIEMYTTPNGELVEDPFELTKKYNEFKGAVKPVSDIEMGMSRGTATPLPDEEKRKDAEGIKESLKVAGIDVDKFSKQIKDVPDELYNIPGFSKEEILQEINDNPQRAERRLATGKWQLGFKKELESSDLTPEAKDNIWNSVLSIQNNSDVGNYDQQRRGVRELVNTINQYGGENKNKLLRDLAIDRAKTYGKAFDNKFSETAKEDKKSEFLDDDQLLGMQYLEDTQPEVAKGYNAILIDPKKIEGNTFAKHGWEEKMLRITELGIGLQQSHLQEEINDLQKIAKQQGEPTPEQIEKYSQLELKQHELNAKLSEAKLKYWSPSYYDREMAAQELLGQKNTGGSYITSKIGQATYNTVSGLQDIAYETFASDEANKIHQLAAAGENMADEAYTYVTQKNSALQNFELKVKPELQQKIDLIKNDSNLSDEEKSDKVYDLLRDNPDEWGRLPIQGGRVNVSPSSMFYSVAGLGAILVPFMAVEAATGGIGGVGTAGKLLRTFNAAMATGVHETYAAGVREGVANPMGHAIRVTAINSAALAGAMSPQAIRAMLGTKTAIGELVSKMSDDAINAALKETPSALKKFGKSIAGSFKTATKEGGKITAFTTGGEAINTAISGKEIDTEMLAKQALVGTLTFSFGGGLAGIKARYDKINNLQADALVRATTQPELFIEAANQQLKDGNLSVEQFNNIKNNIEKAGEVSKKVPFVGNDGKPLSVNNRAKLLMLKMQESELKEATKGDAPPNLKEKNDLKLEELNTEIEEVYKNKHEGVVVEPPKKVAESIPLEESTVSVESPKKIAETVELVEDSVTKLEKERDAEIEKVVKPDLKLELVSSKDLVDSKDPIGNREKHNELKERYKSLRKLIDCL